MRKALIDSMERAGKLASPAATFWLDRDDIASSEITSEDPLFPIEHAHGGTANAGWRAVAKGPQVIRINFDHAIAIQHIHLHFTDLAAERSQEFAIHARTERGGLREILSQKFTFSPGDTSEEIENYTVDFSAVTPLKLRIDPERAHNPAYSQHYAILKSLRLA